MRHTTSGRYYSPKAAARPEGPIRTMMVRDDRAWVAGGRAEPWLAIFDAVQGGLLECYLRTACDHVTAVAASLAGDDSPHGCCVAEHGAPGAEKLYKPMSWNKVTVVLMRLEMF